MNAPRTFVPQATRVAEPAAAPRTYPEHKPERIYLFGTCVVDLFFPEAGMDAIRLLERAAGGLEYVEQPCATLEEMAALRRRVDVPLAADESVRTAEDPLRIAGLEAADIVVVKVQPLGGVRRALAVIEAAGLPAVVSSAVETSVGLSAGLALAAALPELPHACGLGTAMLLAGDVVADPLVPVDGRLRVRRVEPDPELLERWAPGDPEAVLDRYRAAAAAAGAAVPEEGGL